MITDANGMILSGGDGGDSCKEMYTTHLREAIQVKLGLTPPDYPTVADPLKSQLLLEPDVNGIYIRNPDLTKWYSDPRNLSRDQLVPVIAYHALTENRAAQWRLLRECLKRYMFAQNIYPNWVDPRVTPQTAKTPDFITPDLWAVFARTWIKSLWFPLAFPIIILGDACLVISALFKVFAPISTDGTLDLHMPGPDDVDDDNMNNSLMISQYKFQTPFSWIARKLYKTFRSKNDGNLILGETNAIMGALMWYNHNDNPEIAELARPIVEKY